LDCRTNAGDFGVEGFDADAKTDGFTFSDAIVLGGGEGGEACESDFVGIGVIFEFRISIFDLDGLRRGRPALARLRCGEPGFV